MSRLYFLPLLYLTSINIAPSLGYSLGSPRSQCGSMTPGHGLQPQDNSNAPYQVSLSASKIAKGSEVIVELKSNSGDTFKGFIVEARSAEGDSIIGTFETISDDAIYLSCDRKPQTGVTHSNSSPKKSVKVKWSPPSDFTGNVKVLGSFVKEYNTYWVKLESQTLEITKSDGGDGFVFPSENSSPEPESEVEPEPEGEGEPEPESEGEPEPQSEGEPEVEPEGEPSSKGKSGVYEDCGSSKSCLGVPKDCLDSSNCKLFASWKKVSSQYEWELRSTSGAGAYVALGFSTDSKMGDDLVMACAASNKAELYWNEGQRPGLINTNNGGVISYSLKREDGSLYCKITTEEKITADSHTVDLSEKQNLLLAGGSYSGGGGISYHSQDKIASSQPVNLALVSLVAGSSDLFFRLHGLLMLCAWLGCAGVGMILARYFKKTWRGKQILGKDLWFQFHRILMILTVLLSIAAVVLILVEVDVQPLAISSLKNNAHPIIGLCCVILAIIQPIMAAFRPHPGAAGRNLFNWAHWAVGNTAHCCGVVAIFLAGTLAKANLASNSWWTWTMLGYVIFHFLVHIFLSFLMAKEERSSTVRDTQVQMMNGKVSPMDYDDGVSAESGSGPRKFLMFVYLVAAWGVAAALIVAVFQA